MSLGSFDAAEDGPEIVVPGTIGCGEAGGAEIGELGVDRFVAIVAGFFGLTETSDIAVDPAVQRVVKSWRNTAAGHFASHVVGPGC